MNITFIIGNGFDLNLGMRTDYISFLESPDTKKRLHENRIYQLYEKDKDSNLSNTWSNMEKQLGLLTSKFRLKRNDEMDDPIVADDPDPFIQAKSQLEEELIRYLLEQERQKLEELSKDEQYIVNQMIGSFSILLDNSKPSEQAEIEKILDKHKSETWCCNYVTFNYTRVLDKTIEICKKNRTPVNRFLGKSVTRQFNSNIILNIPIHVHGTSKRPVLGVNDESQISESTYYRDSTFTTYMIKEKINGENGEGLYEKTENILNNSKIIIIFGMSFGETDKRWWEFLVNWSIHPDHRLIILDYIKNYDDSVSVTPYVYNETKKNIKKKLINGFVLDEDVVTKFYKNSIAIANPGIFNFSKVQDEI